MIIGKNCTKNPLFFTEKKLEKTVAFIALFSYHLNNGKEGEVNSPHKL